MDQDMDNERAVPLDEADDLTADELITVFRLTNTVDSEDAPWDDEGLVGEELEALLRQPLDHDEADEADRQITQEWNAAVARVRAGRPLQRVRSSIEESFPGLWPAVDTGLAVCASLLLKDNVNPVALIYPGWPIVEQDDCG